MDGAGGDIDDIAGMDPELSQDLVELAVRDQPSVLVGRGVAADGGDVGEELRAVLPLRLRGPCYRRGKQRFGGLSRATGEGTRGWLLARTDRRSDQGKARYSGGA